MTMVDPVLVASQFDEDEAEAILRYNIRKYLKANRVSQNSLMDVLNITSGAVSQLMTGRTHFKYGQVAAIANYLHVSMDDLSNATQFNEDRNFLERMKKEYSGSKKASNQSEAFNELLRLGLNQRPSDIRFWLAAVGLFATGVDNTPALLFLQIGVSSRMSLGSDEEVTSLFYALKEPHEVLERQQEELRTRRATGGLERIH